MGGIEPDPGDEPTCVGGKPAFYLRGDNNGPIPWDDYDVVYPFELELDEDSATFTATTLAGGDGIRVGIESNDDVHKWHAIFRTRTGGEQLQPGVYEVEETSFERTGPTMDINAFASNYPAQSRSCAYVCGSFEVLDIQVTGSRVDRFRANFAQHCTCAQAALRGCVNFTQ